MRMKYSWSPAPWPTGSSEFLSETFSALLYTLISPIHLISLPVQRWRQLRRSKGGGVEIRSRRLAAQARRKAGSDMVFDGENQTRASAQQLLLAGVQLTLQRLLWCAAASFSICTPAQPSSNIRPAAGRPVGCDGSVAKHEGQVGVVVDQIRVRVPQLLGILKTNPEWNMRGGMESTGMTHSQIQNAHAGHMTWEQMKRLTFTA